MSSPRYLIASDLHGSSLYTRQLIEACEREQPDELILLGDVLYHGPRNPLPDGYDPAGVIRLLTPWASRILAVQGNCDSQVDQMVLPFPLLSETALLFEAGHRVLLTHGHRINTENPPSLGEGDVLLHGHTHVPACQLQPAGWLYVNPGSVSLPKEGSPRGYLMLEDSMLTWKTLSGQSWKTADLSALSAKA